MNSSLLNNNKIQKGKRSEKCDTQFVTILQRFAKMRSQYISRMLRADG